MQALSKDQLDSYLYFGYIPDHDKANDFMIWIDSILEQERYQDFTEAELIKAGDQALRNIFAEVPEGTHVVPLSGGLDSRCILANLLEHKEAKDIYTITFGSPGTWDFEFGNLVAKQAGTNHTTLDLENVTIDHQSLIEYASRLEYPLPVFECYYNSLVFKAFGQDANYWTGYIADTSSGAWVFHTVPQSWSAALSDYMGMERIPEVTLHSSSQFVNNFPSSPWLDNSKATHFEQLMIGYRQPSYVGPQLIYYANMMNVIVPFMDEDWWRFIMSVPRKYRINQGLYKTILETSWPDLYSLPNKRAQGKSLSKKNRLRRMIKKLTQPTKWNIDIHPWTNFVDLAAGFRNRDDFKNLAYEQLQDLKKRNLVPHVDVDEIWSMHQNGIINFQRQITVLLSLELWLKSRETISSPSM